MNTIFLIIGIVLLAAVTFDFMQTVFIPKGAGLLTQYITISVALFYKLLTGNNGSNKLLDYKGLAIIITMITTWLTLIWFSVTFIYAFDASSVIDGQTKENATFIEKLYFTGYTLSTLGLGEYQPHGKFWMVFTSMVSVTGFIIVTISITYIVPVINNIIEKITLSLQIASLGESPEKMLINGYDGSSFEGLSDQFSSLSSSIFRYAKNHAAYPILHHVHSSDKDENTILKLVSLDEACTLLMYHIPEEKCMQKINLQQVRRAITFYLESLRNVKKSEEQPPPPNFDLLEESLGIRLKNRRGNDLEKLYEKLGPRRQLLKGLVEDDGFNWQSLKGNKFQRNMDIMV